MTALEMVGNWAGQRRGIRLSAERCSDSTQDFLSISFSTPTRWDQTNRKIVLTVMLGNSHRNDDDDDGNVMR